jgi:hypothetical protein
MAKRRTAKRQNYKGGAGAADFAISVYGGVNAQHAVSPTDNTITMSHPSMQGPDQTAMKGGNKGGEQLRKLQQQIQQAMDKLKQSGGGDESAAVDGADGTVGGNMMSKLQQLQKQMAQYGGKMSKKQLSKIASFFNRQSGGSGILESVAVPAIFLYVNQIASKKSCSEKKLRKTRRMSRRLRK